MKYENGFTLIELLAAMVAGSLLLASLGWSVSTLAREMQVSSADRPADQLNRLSPALTRLIEGAIPPDVDGPTVTMSRDLLVFRTSPPLALGPVGPVTVSLNIEDTAAGAALAMTMVPADDSVPYPPAMRKAQMLATGFAAIRFDFRASTEVDRPLPQLVTVTFQTNEGRQYRLSVAPKINTSGHCRFDPISMTCRP